MIADMLPALDKFVSYGSETLSANPAYLEAVIGMVQDIFHDDKVGGVDRICGCKLAEAVMLNLRGRVDDHISTFIELGMTTLTNQELKVKSYRIHLMEMIINAIYYNPTLALHILESRGWTNKFFSLWFSNIDSFSRVHDKKLSIAAVIALLDLRADQIPASVQQGWPRLLTGVIRLFQTLPNALKSKGDHSRQRLANANALQIAKRPRRKITSSRASMRRKKTLKGGRATITGRRRPKSKEMSKMRVRRTLTS